MINIEQKEAAERLLIEYEYQDKTCCICGDKAVNKHWSIVGSIPFYVCQKHYESTTSAIGHCSEINNNRMGLIDIETHKFIDLKP